MPLMALAATVPQRVTCLPRRASVRSPPFGRVSRHVKEPHGRHGAFARRGAAGGRL